MSIEWREQGRQPHLYDELLDDHAWESHLRADFQARIFELRNADA